MTMDIPETTVNIAVIAISAVVAIILLYFSRGTHYLSKNTDNEKWVNCAAIAGKWRWLSDMHRYANGKAWMKDFHILLLVLIQRMMGDKSSQYPLVVLTIVGHALSSILVYECASFYWNYYVAFLVFIVYVSSFLPVYYVLMGGQAAITSQLCFLFSVFMIQKYVSLLNDLFLLLAGGSFVLMMFSAGHARKYLLFILSALYFGIYNYSVKLGSALDTFSVLNWALFCGVVILVGLMTHIGRFVIIGSVRHGHVSQDDLLRLAGAIHLLFFFSATVVVMNLLVPLEIYLNALGYFVAGGVVILLLLLAPKFTTNIHGWFGYATFPLWFHWHATGYIGA